MRTLAALTAALICICGCNKTNQNGSVPASSTATSGDVMAQNVSFDFGGISLADAIKFIEDSAKVRFNIAEGARPAVASTMVQLRVQDVPLREALTQLLQPHGLKHSFDAQTQTVTVSNA